MKLKNVLPYIAGPGRVFLSILIVLIVISFLQAIALEAISFLAFTKHAAATKSETELTENEKKIKRLRSSLKEFLPDGTLHLVDGPWFESGQFGKPGTERIYDTNDNLLWEGPSDKRPYEYLSWAKPQRRYSEAFEVMQMKQMQMLTPEFSQTIEVPVGSINNTEQVWRYCPGAEYFEGYAVGSRQRIGYISAAGFTDSKSKVKPFGEFRLFTAWSPHDSSTPTLLWQTNRRVYQINFEKKQTELLFESANSDIETISLHGWKYLRPGTKDYIDTEKYRPLLMCVTEDGVHHLILREPDQQLSLPGPHCSITATRQGIFVMRPGTDAARALPLGASAQLQKEWSEQYRNKPQKIWVELYKVSNEGGLELLNRYDWTVPVAGRYVQMETRTAAQRFVTHFSPPLYNLVLRVTGAGFWARVQSKQRGNFLCDMLQAIVYLRPLNNTVNLTLSVLMMGFVFWYGLPRRVSNIQFAFWLLFVGLLNLAGLLTYLALNYTAAIKCPVCGRRRGLAQPDCVRCRAPLPAPKPRDLDLILMNQ